MSTSSPTVDEIEQYRTPVTRYIRHLVRDAGEAEDIAQETLLRAHRLRSTLRDPAASCGGGGAVRSAGGFTDPFPSVGAVPFHSQQGNCRPASHGSRRLKAKDRSDPSTFDLRLAPVGGHLFTQWLEESTSRFFFT
ncbi:MAG: sigma factor [Terriglobia bacterium]